MFYSRCLDGRVLDVFCRKLLLLEFCWWCRAKNRTGNIDVSIDWDWHVRYRNITEKPRPRIHADHARWLVRWKLFSVTIRIGICRLSRTSLLSTISHVKGDLREAWCGVLGFPHKSIVFRRPHVFSFRSWRGASKTPITYYMYSNRKARTGP